MPGCNHSHLSDLSPEELYDLSFQTKVKVFRTNSGPEISRLLLKSVNEA